MNRSKAGIVRDICKRTGMPRVEAEAFIDAFFEEIANTVLSGDKVTIPGFGTFKASMKATNVISMQNGRKIPCEGIGVFQFIPARKLLEEISQMVTIIDPLM